MTAHATADLRHDWSIDDVLALLRTALAADGNRKTAIATVMAATGESRRRLYDLALTLPRTAEAPS